MSSAGLVGYWTFEEGSGTSTADQSGNGLTGTFDNVATWGGPVWTNSPLGTNCLSFDGVNDRVSLGNPTSLQITGAMTVSAWISPRAFNTSGRVVAKQGASGSRGWSLNVENTTGPGKSGSFMVASSSTALISVVTANSLASNRWVHLCGVYEPGVGLRIYTNGFFNNSAANALAKQYNSTLNVCIGGRPSGSVDNDFNGLVDCVRIYDVALTEAQIQALPELAQTPLSFKTQPASRIIIENRPVTFQTTFTGPPPYYIQWYENDSPIPGAEGSTYTIPAVQPYMNGYRYSVSVSNLVYGVVSSNAVLTVSSDTNPPVLVSAGSVDGNSIGVCFSEPMDQNLLWDGSHFTVNGGAVAVSWTMPRPDGYGVVVNLAAPITGAFTVQVSGVTDLVGNPIAAGATTNGIVAGLSAADLGVPAQLGETFSCRGGAYEMTAGGTDIWNTSDLGHFVSQQVSGDFDVSVQVPSLLPVNNTAKAGLMVRQTLDANSPTLHLLANPPPPGGRGYIEPGRRATAGGATTAWGATYTGAVMPDVWLRLRRWGDQFAAFRSTNGVDWILMGQTLSPFSDPVYLGLAACSHTAADATVAKFQDYRNVVFPNVTVAFTEQPASLSILQNTVATFQVQAQGAGAPASELAYQWQRDNGAGGFTNLVGATGTSYSFVARGGDANAQFRAQAYFAGLVTNSVTATLTVNPETIKPTVLSVVSAGDPTKIYVTFSEELDPVSALATDSYQLTGPGSPPTISAAAFSGNTWTVVLTTSGELTDGGNYTLGVQNVLDLAVPPNMINSTQVNFQHTSLAGYWRFEEGTGGITTDASGNNLAGTLINSPPWVLGQFGQYALSFNGANQRVDVGNPAQLQITGPMTVSAWAWPASISDSGRIITKGGGGGARGWALNVESVDLWRLQIAVDANTLVSCGSSGVPLNTWTHVAGVFDPNDPGGPVMKFYTNGVLAATLTSGVPFVQYNSGVNVSIGSRASGDTRWNGKIDEVRVYARALGDSEIAALATPPVYPPIFLPPVISGGKIHLNWTGSGRLEWAPAASGPWAQLVPWPAPPLALDLVPGENRFFRLNATP